MYPASSSPSPLRVFCLEDNPLIVFHLEQMIEDLGHVFAGSAESFVELKAEATTNEIDCALIDIDLADGPTGPLALIWLAERGIPSAFVTGQAVVAAQYAELALAVVIKPIQEIALAAALRSLEAGRSRRR